MMKEKAIKKEDREFEFLIDEYNILWDYYNKLHDERQRIFDNFTKMIGLPITLIGIWFAIPDNKSILNPNAILFIVLLVFVISTIGHIYMYIFVKETFNAIKYTEKVYEIKNIIAANYAGREVQNICKRKNLKKGRNLVKTAKVFIIAIINATVFGVMILLFQFYLNRAMKEYLWICIICFLIDLIIQLALYFHYKLEFEKENKFKTKK